MSVRVGGRGYGVTMGTAGARVSAGIPGTGLYVTERLGSSGATRSGATVSTPDIALPPVESGTQPPTGWVVGTIIFTLIGFGGATFAIPIALICALLAWRGFRSPRYVAINAIRAARARSATEPNPADDGVRSAARLAKDSWTVQQEASSYFMFRKDPTSAFPYLENALRLFPGDKRSLLMMAGEIALASGDYTWVIGALEPYVASMNPDSSDSDAVLLSMLGLALYAVGEPGKALELVGRLPLRRRNLSESLLLGLCVRAIAKHATGKKADARRDLDRVYALNPGFPFLEKAQAIIAQADSG